MYNFTIIGLGHEGVRIREVKFPNPFPKTRILRPGEAAEIGPHLKTIDTTQVSVTKGDVKEELQVGNRPFGILIHANSR